MGGWGTHSIPTARLKPGLKSLFLCFLTGLPTGLEPLGGLGPACSVTGVPGLQLVPGTQTVVQTGRVEGVLGVITEHNRGPGAF